MTTARDTISTAGGLMASGDVAALAGVQPETVNQWTHRYPALRAIGFRTSGGWVWLRADAEAWLRETGRLTPRPISPAST